MVASQDTVLFRRKETGEAMTKIGAPEKSHGDQVVELLSVGLEKQAEKRMADLINRPKDIVEVLKEALNRRPGTADSDVNVFAIPVTIQWGDVVRAYEEIERLRDEVVYWRHKP